MQKITMIGNLGREPEERVTPNGNKLLTFSVGVNAGKDTTVWYDCDIWGDKIQMFGGLMNYLKKGSRVLIMGDLQPPHPYQGKDGTLKVRNKVNPFSINFVGAKTEKSGGYRDLDSRINNNIKQQDSLFANGIDPSTLPTEEPPF